MATKPAAVHQQQRQEAWADQAKTARCAAAGHAGRHYAAADGERYCAACLGAAWYRSHAPDLSRLPHGDEEAAG